ncbi:hypothetical protein D3C84_624550 [compost metagenome]
MLTHQVHGKWQMGDRVFDPGKVLLLLLVQPLLRRAAVAHAAAGAHVVAGSVDQVGLGLDEIIAPVSWRHVRHGHDQAGATQALKIGGADLTEPVITHAFGPGQVDGLRGITVTGMVHEHPQAIGLQIDQIGRARAVEVGQQHL